MLTEAEIQALRDITIRLADPINEYIIGDICERIAAAGKFTSTADYLAFRAHTLGLRWPELRREIAKRMGVTVQAVDRLYSEAAQRTYMDDVRRLARGGDFTQNPIVQQITRVAAELAESDLFNLTQTLGMIAPSGQEMPLRDVYGKTMDFVFSNVTAGAMDYNTAVRLASAKLAERGVTSIQYESGVVTSLEAAVRRNIMGGLGLMVERISQHNFEALEADGWEISAHAMSAPDHEPIQGRQYPATEYETLNNSLVRRIGTLNCGHNAFPIILGVNEPQYTPEELRKLAEDNAKGVTIGGKHYTLYEATQRQRDLERRMRSAKRRYLAASATGDAAKAQEQAARLGNLQGEYKTFSKAAGLRTQDERIHVSGFGHREGAAASAAEKQLEKQEQAAYNKAVEDARAVIAENPKTVVVGQQNKHIPGTREYEQKVQQLHERGQYGPSRFNGTLEDAQRILSQYAGTGTPDVKKGKWRNAELVLLDSDTWGTVANNLTGALVPTRAFKIHYRKSGAHIVPDYPSKEESAK